MGQIIKLSESFTNTALPTLVDYDPAQVKAEILRIPTLRAFHDFTDEAQITKDGSNLVSQVNDQSGNGLHFTASANKPTFTPGAMASVADGVVFDGATTAMQGAGLFSGATRYTMVAAVYADGADGTSRAILSDDSDNNLNLYLTNAALRGLGADVTLIASGVTSSIHYAIMGVDTIADTASLYGKDGVDADTSTRLAPAGDATLGAFDAGAAYFDGVIGTLMLFDEDLAANNLVRALVVDYFTRKFRLS